MPAIAQMMIARMQTITKFRWMPGRLAAGSDDQEREALAALAGLAVETRHEPTGGERAEREEGHVTEVEQPREPDDDVQPEGHHRVRQDQHRDAEEGAVLIVGERQVDRPEQQRHHYGDRHAAVIREQDAQQDEQAENERHAQAHVEQLGGEDDDQGHGDGRREQRLLVGLRPRHG